MADIFINVSFFSVSKSIRTTKNSNNDTWSDHCFKRPVIKPPSFLDLLGRKKRQTGDGDFLDDDDFFDFGEEEEKDVVFVSADSLDPMKIATKYRYLYV